MRSKCTEKGDIGTMPDILGVLVFMNGHVGIYIGSGEVIEARGHEYGVVKTKLGSRPWKWWGKCPYIEYAAPADKEIRIKVRAGSWNVRSMPNTAGKIITVVNGAALLYADKIDPVSGWFHIPKFNGWISCKAVEKV
ncbi:MAG: hypothetical protein ACI4KF_13130 [Huintestinicola sp.]